MPTVLFRPIKSTYVSNIEKCENFYTLNYLSLANYSKNCAFIKDTVLMLFDLSLLETDTEDENTTTVNITTVNEENITIRNAYLILPLNQAYLNKCALYKGISLFAITEIIPFCEVTWETVPKSKYITTSYLTKQVIEQKYITFKITDLVNDWLNSSCTENLGIILCNQACDSIIISPKDSVLTSPVLEVEYVEDEVEDVTENICDTECDINCINECENECENECDDEYDSVAIELQLTDLNDRLIGSFEPILYNEIILKTPTGISYNELDGEIIITKEGCYNFQLEIDVKGFSDKSPINIALKNLTKGICIDFRISPHNKEKLIGTAVINVTEPVERFNVVNNSNSTIQLCDTDVQSTLTVSKI